MKLCVFSVDLSLAMAALAATPPASTAVWGDHRDLLCA